jgi:hypothetical protein
MLQTGPTVAAARSMPTPVRIAVAITGRQSVACNRFQYIILTRKLQVRIERLYQRAWQLQAHGVAG